MVNSLYPDGGLRTRTSSQPIPAPRTDRPLVYRNLTSGNAGKMIPLLVMPLLREDSVAGARFRTMIAMDETVEILMNAVNVRIMTYLVPRLAFDRFNGWDDLNRSYEGVTTIPGGGTVPPWFEFITAPADPKTNQIHYTLGIHMKAGEGYNTDYIEAYNQIWNFRAKNRSPKLTLRSRLDQTLAPAFWNHQTWAHVVPDFDQAIIDGEVPLNVTTPGASIKSYVSGIATYGANGTNFAASGSNSFYESGKTGATTPNWSFHRAVDSSIAGQELAIRGTAATGKNPDIYVDMKAVFDEMAAGGVTVSLSNIELARKTQAFANLRRQYAGHSDQWIIDMLMDGLSIPDMAWQQPILLSDQSTVFGMAKRWASDGPSLTESVTNGATFVDFGFSCPKVPCGGVIMVVAEIAPEQLFERQLDPYVTSSLPSQLPSYLRDALDPEKVQIVTNREVDVQHATPSGTFGYAPLNHQWAKSIPRVGGRFTRPVADTFLEYRQRIWAVETANPVLGRDFYLVTDMNYAPFVVTDKATDHFEFMTSGSSNIRGLTVFGDMLIEANDDYDKVMAEAPTGRLPPTPALAEDGDQTAEA